MIVMSGRGHAPLALAAVAVAAMPLYASAYHQQLASTALVAGMFALSLQVLVGGAGLVSLGHAGFFGLGAYAAYLLAAWPMPVTLAGSMLAAATAATVIGAVALRSRGFFFLMTTLAFGQMLFFVFHDTKIGGGADGAFLTRPVLAAFGYSTSVGRRDLPATLLWLNLSVLVAMYALLAAVMGTLFGRALLGVRANEGRMAAMGHDVQGIKRAAFILAGAMAGVAGHMSAVTEAFVTPDLLGWHRSAEALLMVLLGGVGALHGPLLGAAAFTVLTEVSGLVTNRPRLIEGAVILAAVLLLPRGLAGLGMRR